MKTIFCRIALIPLLSVSVPAQVNQLSPIQPTASFKSSVLEIGERGDHYRVWQRVTVEVCPDGNLISRTNAAYTELETGMNVRRRDGTWVEASDEIEITKAGAVARKGRHRVNFAVNCNSPVAIDMVTADGKRLQSRILGLAFYDTATGQSVLISEIKDSDGQLLLDAKNEVIYYDAFTDFKADVRYHNSKAGLEQDIILRENPPSPIDYGLSPATTVLEVLTEWFNPPVPEKKARFRHGPVDEFLDFGDLKMGRGRVFVMGEETAEIPVCKQWGKLDGRTFLIEEIPYHSVERELKALPPRTASLKSSSDGVLHQVSIKRLLPAVKRAKQTTGPMRLANASFSGKGVVLDYVTASSATNYTFKGDTTYYVSGTVNLSGTTTIEGGTVVKYTNSSSAKINLAGPVNCQSGQYRPAVFTAKDDNSVGEAISGSSGVPTNTYANPALFVDYYAAQVSVTLQHLRVAYATVGIQYNAITFGPSDDQFLSHIQIINCQDGIKNAWAGEPVYLRNALFYNTINVFTGNGGTLHGEHLTIHNANWLNGSGPYFFTTVHLTNSLLVDVTNAGSFSGNSVAVGTGSDFQTVGAGSHYLANNTYRNAGTTSINPGLAADLKKLTTYPPLELTNNFAVDTVLAPQAQRDTDQPDLGYHYGPLDYVVSGRTLANSTLTLTNGVAIGTFGSSSGYGVSVGTLGRFISQGSPGALNRVTRYNTVQEQATTNWSSSTVGSSIRYGTGTGQDVKCRFTEWSLLANRGYHFNGSGATAGFQDCQFSGGKFNLSEVQFGLTNSLWERTIFSAANTSAPFYMYNNLIKAGSWSLFFYSNNGTARDNTFDACTPYDDDYAMINDHNAYINCYPLSGSGGSDKTLTNAVYQIGPLGRYYYPTNGGQLSTLLGAGSRNATNAGLYQYTVTTNQVKETNSVVDIGFHYVSVDGNGNALDTDGDGLADYLEDANGDGSYNAGDLASWYSPDTDGDGVADGIETIQGRNPTVAGTTPDSNNLTQLKVFTPLK